MTDIIERVLCDFTVGRTAQIRHRGFLGPKFELESGVPQGAIMSPSLFNVFGSGLPLAEPQCLNVAFADDITQVIIHRGTSREMMKRKTERAIESINEFEKKWKIQTNSNKFQMLSVSKLLPPDIVIDGNQIQYANNINILGLNWKRTGINNHIPIRVAAARGACNKLKRFDGLNPKIKDHLYKSYSEAHLGLPSLNNGCHIKLKYIKNAVYTK